MSDKIVSNSAVNELFSWIEKNVDEKSALYEAAHGYMEKERANAEKGAKDEGKPFLSIVIRTQGKRPEMLTEVLLGLTGQSNTDFELLLMGHNLSHAQHASVSEIIHDMPDWMQDRTRLIPVNGGTRTTPLNAGFTAARGSYIAVLDDDDLVFDNWVECFYEAAQTENGKILHAYSVFQDWETVGFQFPDTPRAIGSIQNIFCKDFVFPSQLNANSCPLCSLAFPANLFHELGIRFDESLTTTEDWDFLMRCSFLVGVHNIPRITFLYRNWVNAENSKTLHKAQEWMDNYNTIRDRFSKMPAVLTSEEVSALLVPVAQDVGSNNDAPLSLFIPELELFYDCGNGFNEVDKRIGQSTLNQEWPISISAFGGNQISALRLDPCPNGGITIGFLRAKVLLADGQELLFGMKDIKTNGIVINDHIVFIKNDPQIILTFDKPVEIQRVFFSYDFSPAIDDEVIRVLTSRSPFFYRVCRKIRKLFGGKK